MEKKCFGLLKIKILTLEKNVILWNALNKSQEGYHDGDSYFACYLTDHTNWKRFWINFSSEKTGIPFCEAFLSNVTLLYFARTLFVFIIPRGGLALASNQLRTEPLTRSLLPSGLRRKNRKKKSEKTCVL